MVRKRKNVGMCVLTVGAGVVLQKGLYVRSLHIAWNKKHNVCAILIRFSLQFLVKVFLMDNLSQVTIPTEEDITIFKQSVLNKYSTLTDVYAAVNVLKLRLEKSGVSVIQKLFCNSWAHDQYVG